VEPAQAKSFLDAAESVLESANKPLHPTEITKIAKNRRLIETAGLTPEQTMKAKLSTDILTHKESSRFMRTDRNEFGLRHWRGRYDEYIADRFQKALLDEEIVVFDRDLLGSFIPRPGLFELSPEASQELLVSLRPMQRREAEEDMSVIQLVSAFLVRAGDRIATYKRTRRLPESRLHGVYSLLFGGHLNPDDVPPLFSIFDPDLGSSFIQRELHEELRFSQPPPMTLRGVIYDTSREVSVQHLGVMYEVNVPQSESIEVGERGFLQHLAFETPQEILDRMDDFENWSELVLREHVLRQQ
jgi:predicted NUDIX family phosphoesterase